MSQSISPELLSASTIAIRDCMGAKPNESVLIVTDEPLRPIGLALRQAARDLGHDVMLLEMLPRPTHGAEPPPHVAQFMTTVDVVLCPTSKSLTHTEARRTATAAGARVGTLPGVTEAIMVRCMNADYQRIADRTDRLCGLMKGSKMIRVVAPAGTDMIMPVEGRLPIASTGLFRERGQFGNLPTGEAYLAPLEGQSNGVVVVDGSMAGVGVVTKPIRIVVKNGQATDITGGREAEQLVALLQPHGEPGRNLAEFGIGTNDRAQLSGVILEDEKVMGTIHIAFGDNKSMGGTVRVASHLDGLVKQPTVWFDDRLIMDAGRLLVDG
ncbi:MAG TPA: aminopeptidase [Vicinamibacterales bacterium]